MFGDYDRDLGLIQPSHATNTIPGDFSTNAVGCMHWDDNLLGSVIATSEPIHVPAVELYTFSQAAGTIQQYGNLPINGFQPQGEGYMTALPMSSALPTLQTLDSTFEPGLDKEITPSQPSLSQPSPYQQSPSQPRPVNHHLESRKQMRGDPTPNEQGQYVCTYEGCAKKNCTFRLLCHWK
jgi:hypothetical protein